MQNQKTDTKAAFASLTEKQRDFLVNYLEGGDASAAYRKAYDAENMSAGAIRVEACRLKQHPNIALILDSLAAEQLDKAKTNREEHLKELARLSARAELAGNYGAAIQAEIHRGKAVGLYAEKKDPNVRTPQDVLNDIAAKYPDFALKLARGYVKEGNETKH